MEYLLSQEQIEECREKFNLSYHVSYAALCQKLVGFAGKDVLEVGGSLPERFVFDYLHVRSWSAVETPSYEKSLKEAQGITFTGTILRDHTRTDLRGFDGREIGGYRFFYDSIEELPETYYSRFDLIFSVAAFEHIHRFPQALDKMYSALKPGGRLFSLFSPVWSSFSGYHLPEITDKNGTVFSFTNPPIPPWGHLLYSPPELFEHLRGKTDFDSAATILYYIYNAPNINRFFIEDYLSFIRQSRFTIDNFEPAFQTDALPVDSERKLRALYPRYSIFSYNGLLIQLRK